LPEVSQPSKSKHLGPSVGVTGRPRTGQASLGSPGVYTGTASSEPQTTLTHDSMNAVYDVHYQVLSLPERTGRRIDDGWVGSDRGCGPAGLAAIYALRPVRWQPPSVDAVIAVPRHGRCITGHCIGTALCTSCLPSRR